MCPIDGYFDTVFATSGDKVAVPDPIQGSGTVSYDQGYPIGYSTPVASGGILIPRTSMNQIFFDITSALQQYQQAGTPPFITSTMNGGTPYSYPKYARVISGGIAYQSLSNANTDTPPSANWQVDLAPLGNNVFTGGTTTGSANIQAVASVSPAASGFTNGQSVICTAGFTNTGSMTFSAGGESALTAKKDSGSGLVVLAAGDVAAGDTLILTKNTGGSCWVLTAGFPLGTAAYKAASDNSKADVASVSGSTTAGHVATFADTSGTVQDAGFAMKKGSTVTLSPPSSGTSTAGAHGLGSVPTDCTAYLLCVSSEGGFSSGDRILLGGSCLGIFNTNPVYTITADATNITIGINAIADIEISNKGTQANFTITPSHWQLVVTPYLFG